MDSEGGCNKKKRRRHKEGTKEESALRSRRTIRRDANAEAVPSAARAQRTVVSTAN